MSIRPARGSAALFSIVAIALAVVVWCEARAVHWTTSSTYDEVTYMQMAFRGSFKSLVDAGTAPLPVILTALAVKPYRMPDMDTGLMPSIVRRVRLIHLATVGLPLVLTVYVWLLRRRGWAVAGCAALLLALGPTLIAHASLATTDAAIAFWSVVTLAALAWHHQRGGPGQLLAVALALGMAFAAKYSAVCLIPAVLFSLGWRRGLIVLAGASFVVWTLHGFLSLPLPDPEALLGWLPQGPLRDQGLDVARRTNLPAPMVGALNQWTHQRNGHSAFLFGYTSQHGWWWYFPAAIALKSTPVELAAIVFLPILIALGWRRRDHAFTLWVVTLASFMAMLLVSRVNIGVRYALPVYPLVVLCVADAVSLLLVRATWRAAVGGIAIAAQAFSSLTVAPHYLSYFNLLAGGPAGGYRYLADSNLDWGQDLPALAETIERLGRPRVCVAYFGQTRVLTYVEGTSDWRDRRWCPSSQLLAVSVTYLQVPYIDGHPFAPLLSETPDHRVAYSIFLYDMNRPVVAAAIAKAQASRTE